MILKRTFFNLKYSYISYLLILIFFLYKCYGIFLYENITKEINISEDSTKIKYCGIYLLDINKIKYQNINYINIKNASNENLILYTFYIPSVTEYTIKDLDNNFEFEIPIESIFFDESKLLVYLNKKEGNTYNISYNLAK